MRTGKWVGCIAQLNNQLTHLPHIQQLSCLNGSLAGRHVQHLLAQITACQITAQLSQHFTDFVDKILSVLRLNVRRQATDTQHAFTMRQQRLHLSAKTPRDVPQS